MKKRTVVLYIAAVTLAVAAWLCWLPRAKEIDKVVRATEYSFADPDYAVEHTVTIRGYDTRNVLGKGKFKGTFAVDDWETAQEGWITLASFPLPDHCLNVWYQSPEGYLSSTTDLAALLPNRDWTAFVGLLYEPTGPGSARLDTENCRFLVSGTLSRGEALALGKTLSQGTALEPVFANR